ncbi:SseB family protein [Angustibacter aerolatus]
MSSGPHDSAGVPWGGRELPRGGFDGDDGSADPALVEALQALAAGRGGEPEVVAALAVARVLVPVVAVLGEGEETTHGTADKSADMALVTLTAPDGRRALPVFSGQESLRQWDPTARPVPVDARRAAVSAVAEGCDVVVLDPAGPLPFVLPRPALWAIGQGRSWVAAHDDPDVLAALRLAVRDEPDVVDVAGEPGEQAQLRVRLLVRPGLDPSAVRELGGRVGAALQASDVVRERVDGVELALAAAPD